MEGYAVIRELGIKSKLKCLLILKVLKSKSIGLDKEACRLSLWYQ
jgi:hypothetical protein